MTRTLYRAARSAQIARGANFAAKRECAEAYRDNPGFGGPRLYEARVRDEYVARIDEAGDLWNLLQRVNVERGPIWLREMAKDSRENAREYVRHQYVHEYTADSPRVLAVLAQGWDWLVFQDSFPANCETWCCLDPNAVISVEAT